MRRCYQISQDGRGFGHGRWSGFSRFFSKTKPKEENVVFKVPLKCRLLFGMVLHPRFKTKRSLRSDVDRSTDRQIDRQIDRQNDNR